MFSIRPLGGGLRQLTHFWHAGTSPFGCLPTERDACNISGILQDPQTGALVFTSSCDPLGANPAGEQIFAMRPDGSGLRQLTAARGRVIEPDGALTMELPGPMFYSTRFR